MTLQATGNYTRVEAAALLNVSASAVLGLVRSGRLETNRIGKRDLVTGVSIARFMGIELEGVRAPIVKRGRTEAEILADYRRAAEKAVFGECHG